MHGARNPALSALRTNRSPSVSDELASLPLWPAGGTCETGPVVCGILHKWLPVRGWRPRLFVLDGGLLRYYKYHGEPRVHVNELIERLQREGTVQIIGTELSRQQAISRREKAKPYGTGEPLPAGEIHLQVANCRTSNVDVKKFYLHSGLSNVPLRAESRDDRRAWLSAILAGKGQTMLTRSRSTALAAEMLPEALRANTPTVPPVDATASRFKTVTGELVQKLKMGGVKMELIELVEKVFGEEHMLMCDMLGEEIEKRRQLVDYMAQVEDDKRLLETAIVVGANKESARGGSASGNGEEESESSSNDAETVDHDSTDEEDLVFYDCDPAQRSARTSEDGSAVSSSSGFSLTGVPKPRRSSVDASDAELIPAGDLPRRNSMHDVPWSPDFLAGFSEPKRRSRLPPPREAEKSVSLWSIIRDCIGKDLTRICLPVFFNEPISALQKGAEDMEYSALLDAAAECGAGSIERLAYVAAFAASGYSSTVGRTRKPFNPLLGETFEFIAPEKGLRYLSEKVCHHPTILTACCQGRGWLYEGDGEVKSKFWGRCIELHPVGLLQVTFADGDVYHWNKVVTSINNLIIGKLNIDHGGVMRVVHKASGQQAKLRFKETSFMDRTPKQVKGHFEDAGGGKVPGAGVFVGKWDEFLSLVHEGGKEEVLWRANPIPQSASNKYNMTPFSITLNEVIGEPSQYAPTDCRLRPDQRALEDGRYGDADREKQRLEQKQRQARKAAEEGKPIEPRWFAPVPGATRGEQLAYSYKGGYFECRTKGQFTGCRDIFGE